jgi:hypothetical protein
MRVSWTTPRPALDVRRWGTLPGQRTARREVRPEVRVSERVEAAMPSPSVARPRLRDQYIASPIFDWLFFIGSPVFALAAVLAATNLLPGERIEYYIIGYMAVGHHVPTMLRAYGDPDEYARNRIQLITVPLCVAPIVVGLTLLDTRLLTLIFVWDQYHFIRQHYGFMRIYDVKAGVRDDLVATLDQWLCYSWFLAILAQSGFYGYMYADSFYDLGIAFPSTLVQSFEYATLAVAGAIGVVYAGNLVLRLSRGEPVAWLKLLLFATNMGVWYYSYVVLSNGFLSYAISSLFHCLQYDAFAWYYNRAKARTLEPTRRNAFFRTIHRTQYLWLYVAAIYAYGLISAYGTEISVVPFLALNTTTGLLHYYFDSFIWRVRRNEFRKHL